MYPLEEKIYIRFVVKFEKRLGAKRVGSHFTIESYTVKKGEMRSYEDKNRYTGTEKRRMYVMS